MGLNGSLIRTSNLDDLPEPSKTDLVQRWEVITTGCGSHLSGVKTGLFLSSEEYVVILCSQMRERQKRNVKRFLKANKLSLCEDDLHWVSFIMSSVTGSRQTNETCYGSPSPNCHTDISFGKFSDRTAGVCACVCGQALVGKNDRREPILVYWGPALCLTCVNEDPAERTETEEGNSPNKVS